MTLGYVQTGEPTSMSAK